jgi:Protein of unknown function (DUF2934)
MNENPPKKLPVSVTKDQPDLDLENQIRMRAYEIYETRGHEDGHDQEDWFHAKEEITIKKFRSATA